MGESVGLLASYTWKHGSSPQVRESPDHLADYQALLRKEGNSCVG
ncbi:hypothetical protein [Paenibacillus larvae]|nr:hypothetical protein [Paenibacillus larvae]MCY7519126.1 hypothetical protein [Paenibacillus larvae]MCY9501673.1 hypothetical protein [Paenibacillus larvae]MCY9509468.1 hypothetical protein [Paenibacillus larvae]MCY9525033.1 hypothetical protein [Paenibacillus larvae]MCY9680653.1 hypothetical protein [Paenibacillus larvae]